MRILLFSIVVAPVVASAELYTIPFEPDVLCAMISLHVTLIGESVALDVSDIPTNVTGTLDVVVTLAEPGHASPIPPSVKLILLFSIV